MSVTGKIKKRTGFTFTWQIEDFTLWALNKNQTIESPVFRIEQLLGTDWKLMLYLPGDEEENIILNLCRCRTEEVGQSRVNVGGKLFIAKTDGSVVFLDKLCNFFEEEFLHTESLSVSRKTVLEAAFLHKDTLTAGFQFFMNNDFPIECIGRSKLSVKKCSVFMPLKFPDGDDEEVIITPMLSTMPECPKLRIYLYSRNFTEATYPIAIKIAVCYFPSKVFVQCGLSFLSKEDLKFESKTNHVVVPCKEYGMIGAQVTRATFFKHSIFEADCIKCELIVTTGDYVSSLEKTIYNKTVQGSGVSNSFDLSYLQSNLLRLYSETCLCDFKINVPSGEFPVHKMVLAAVSPVFRAMFESGMSETNSHQMTIEEFSAETVEKLIEFAYSGNVKDLAWDVTMELYSIADKYQIQKLKTICYSFLKSALSVETVPDLLILADLYSDIFLNKVTDDFIREHSTAVLKSDSWKQFMNKSAQVACQTMCRICQSILQ